MAGPASSATQQHVLGSVDTRGKIGAPANVRMHALDQAAMRRTDVVVAGAFAEAQYGDAQATFDLLAAQSRLEQVTGRMPPVPETNCLMP